jgi:hypothetical protein
MTSLVNSHCQCSPSPDTCAMPPHVSSTMTPRAAGLTNACCGSLVPDSSSAGGMANQLNTLNGWKSPEWHGTTGPQSRHVTSQTSQLLTEPLAGLRGRSTRASALRFDSSLAPFLLPHTMESSNQAPPPYTVKRCECGQHHIARVASINHVGQNR